MAYAPVDLGFFDHPKYLALMERDARAVPLHFWGIAYANEALTDGFVPLIQVRRRIEVEAPLELANALVEVGLWEVAAGGFQIHDFLDHNLSAEQVRHKRELATGRQDRWRRGRRSVSNASPDRASLDVDASRNASTNATSASAIASDSAFTPSAAVEHHRSREAPGAAALVELVYCAVTGVAAVPQSERAHLTGIAGLSPPPSETALRAVFARVVGRPNVGSVAALSLKILRDEREDASDAEGLSGGARNGTSAARARGEVRTGERLAGAAPRVARDRWDTPADELQRVLGHGAGERAPPESAR